MTFFLLTIVAALAFGFIVTRPGMRILTELCPHFFDRIDEFITMGLEGLYTYEPEIDRSSEEELRLEAKLLLPLMYSSAVFALIMSWVAAGLGWSTFGCLVISFLSSLIPFGFGLLVLVVGVIMMRCETAIRSIVGMKGGYTAGDTSPAAGDGMTEPTGLADRAYDFVVDRKEELQAFSKNPRSLLDVLDDLYDAARARLARAWNNRR